MVHALLFNRRSILVNDIKKSIMTFLPEDGSPVEIENPEGETVILGSDDTYALYGVIEEVRRSGEGFVVVVTDKESGGYDNLYSHHTDNIDDLLSVLRLLERKAGRTSMDLGISEEEKKPAYQTIVVQFYEPIHELDHFVEEIDPAVKSLKEWIDTYESSRFTQIGSHVAVITSEYNMSYIKEWLEKNINFAIIKED